MNIFKTEKKEVVTEKTTRQIVAEIHENFYTEVDRLLISAKASNSLETDKQDLINKCNRLKALGFTNAKEVKEGELELERLKKLNIENEAKKEIIEAIEYFRVKYPQYKFITEDSVLNICNKYNLVYGGIERYQGDVPSSNLNHIEQFKIKEEDECFVKTSRYVYSMSDDKKNTYMNRDQFDKEKSIYRSDLIHHQTANFSKCPLEIAAPKNDFDMEGMEVENFKLKAIEIPDPIVLKPVHFKGSKHYLIVTAWGDEASDSEVGNERMN